MRIFRIASGTATGNGSRLELGDVADVWARGDGSVIGSLHGSDRFAVVLPRGIFRCVISKVDDPDFYVDNVVTYTGKTDDGMTIRFTDKCRFEKINGPSSQAAIGAGRRHQASTDPNLFEVDRVCAWCRKKMGTVRSPVDRPSHGMCEACSRKIMESLDAEVAAAMGQARATALASPA